MSASTIGPVGGAGSAHLAAGSSVLLGDIDRAGGDQLPTREEVEVYLSALLQSEHLNILVGSGLTSALAYAAGSHSSANMNAPLPVGDRAVEDAIEVAATATSKAAGRGDEPNIEDRLRVALTVGQGLEYLRDPRADTVATAIDSALDSLRNAVSATELDISAAARSASGTMTVQGLLMTFLGSFAGRAPTRDRLHVFTTNYDRVIEWGAELAGIRIIDRFVGTLKPVFRSSRLEVDYHYSPPGSVRDPRHLDGVFRLTKLHGSLDWEWEPKQRVVMRRNAPFGESPKLSASQLLIYPNSAKDSETTFYPYADLFRDFSAALCRPHSALVVYGYSFGDDHINRVIRDMLAIPSTHLMIISFDDVTKRIERFADEHRRLGQISLMIGSDVASLQSLVERWLPWPSADFLLQKRAQIYRDRSTGTRSAPTA